MSDDMSAVLAKTVSRFTIERKSAEIDLLRRKGREDMARASQNLAAEATGMSADEFHDTLEVDLRLIKRDTDRTIAKINEEIRLANLGACVIGDGVKGDQMAGYYLKAGEEVLKYFGIIEGENPSKNDHNAVDTPMSDASTSDDSTIDHDRCAADINNEAHGKDSDGTSDGGTSGCSTHHGPRAGINNEVHGNADTTGAAGMHVTPAPTSVVEQENLTRPTMTGYDHFQDSSMSHNGHQVAGATAHQATPDPPPEYRAHHKFLPLRQHTGGQNRTEFNAGTNHASGGLSASIQNVPQGQSMQATVSGLADSNAGQQAILDSPAAQPIMQSRKNPVWNAVPTDPLWKAAYPRTRADFVTICNRYTIRSIEQYKENIQGRGERPAVSAESQEKARREMKTKSPEAIWHSAGPRVQKIFLEVFAIVEERAVQRDQHWRTHGVYPRVKSNSTSLERYANCAEMKHWENMRACLEESGASPNLGTQ